MLPTRQKTVRWGDDAEEEQVGVLFNPFTPDLEAQLMGPPPPFPAPKSTAKVAPAPAPPPIAVSNPFSCLETGTDTPEPETTPTLEA